MAMGDRDGATTTTTTTKPFTMGDSLRATHHRATHNEQYCQVPSFYLLIFRELAGHIYLLTLLPSSWPCVCNCGTQNSATFLLFDPGNTRSYTAPVVECLYSLFSKEIRKNGFNH
jgi:hypothetical protein